MALYSLLIGICWLIFVVVWLVSAVKAKRTISGSWSFMGFRIIFIIVVLILIRLQLFQGYWRYGFTRITDPWTGLLGLLLCVIGVAFAIWARMYLGRNWGMPMSLKENPELVTTGPYAYVRNPIYTGILLAMLGSALGVEVWWLAIFIMSAIYFTYSAKTEEKIMMKEFPNEYPAYKKRTKIFVPFVF